jgi:ketosteroid isomerase-like protein
MKCACWILWLCLPWFCPSMYATPCATGQAKDESALVEIEKTWARALDQRDRDTLACILGDEFEDVDIHGHRSNRAEVLAKIMDHRNVQHELSDLHARVHADFGYVRGLATATPAGGGEAIKVRFTDIYVYRSRRWQCVAGQESQVR